MIGNKFNTRQISENKRTIQVSTSIYLLQIDKRTGMLTLKNQEGLLYTSFPISVQTGKFRGFPEGAKITWKREGNTLKMSVSLVKKQILKATVNLFDRFFTIKFLFRPENPLDLSSGITLFQNGGLGFNKSGWNNTFSPEPDRYYGHSPTVDVLVSRDRQWIFAPAPLNLSFETEAGWFSIGIVEIPDATYFGMTGMGLQIDYPWRLVKPDSEGFFKVDRIIFSFSSSEFESISDYRRNLMELGQISDPPLEEKEIPEWWTYPLVCTWGEQMIKKVTYDNTEFNLEWVRNYVLSQEKVLGIKKFTLIIDDKWSRLYGDPGPDSRFADMRKFIDWMHARGHRVLLWWKSWIAEKGSLAEKMGISDNGKVDATHPDFEGYIKKIMKSMLGNGKGELDADGFKVDFMFEVRDPAQANYKRPKLGMGIKELYRYMKIFYKTAKEVKADALITASAPNPHFADVQDMIRLNDDWDDKLRREKRARIVAAALPNHLMDGDAAEMFSTIAAYHYSTSTIYSIPSIYYLTEFHDGPISQELQITISNLMKLALLKGAGKTRFIDYGHWEAIYRGVKRGEVLNNGTLVLIYPEDGSPLFLSIEGGEVTLPSSTEPIEKISEYENKIELNYRLRGEIPVVEGVKAGKIYEIQFQ
ncbi:MAG: hypothetical protein ACE5QV_05595 [Fidelibacterota bacterium]